MKKLFVLLLALACVGAAFAQDAAPALKFSGYLNTGLAYSDGDAEGLVGDPVDSVKINGWDSGTTSRLNLGGAYANGDFGVTFRLRVQDTFNNNSTANIFTRRLFGWQNLFGGKAKVQAGRLGDYSWATGGQYNAFGSIDGPTGVQLQVKPMDGLNLGFFVPATTAGATADDTFNSLQFGANYKMADTFDVQVGYGMSPVDKAADMWFGGNVYAVKDLTLWFEAKMNDLGNDVTGYTYALVSASYALGDLTVGAWFNYTGFAASGTDAQIGLYPNVAYAMGDTTFNFGLAYGMAGDLTAISVEPDVCFTVNKKSTIRVGATYAMGDLSVSKGTGAWAVRGDTLGAFLDFVYNF